MRNAVFAGLLVIGAALPVQAQASEFLFNFGGSGVSGTLTLTYEVNPNTGPLPLTVPNPVDPIGSYIVTGVTGSFSNANIGISNAAVTGLVPLNRVSPTPDNTYAPNSFSLLPVASGIPIPGGGISPGLHYDNLFYPGGSPRAAFDYPFSGGVFDIYGLAFTIDGGDFVNLWSNGDVPGAGLNYGVAVTDGLTVLDYVDGVAIAPVPEPTTWAMMLVGFGMVGGVVRRRARVRIRYA